MNAVIDKVICKTEVVDLRHRVRDVGHSNGQWTQSGVVPLWLKARARVLGFRPDELLRTHWRKVCRTMFED